MRNSTKKAFLTLVRLGIFRVDAAVFIDDVDWEEVKALAEKQGLSGVVLDGVERLSGQRRPPKQFLLRWIGEVLQREQVYIVQEKAAAEMALLFLQNNIRTYVLKGTVVAACYPNPNHRRSSDMDCFLLPIDTDGPDVWEKGNKLMEQAGFKVKRNYYKNSTIYLPGLTVENHRFITPFRGNNRLKKFEKLLQSMIKTDKGEDKFEGTCLCRPPVMVTALFLIEHAYSHFLHEGLTWRHVLDWMLFRRKHKVEIDWNTFDALIDEFGFRKFYDSYYKLGEYMLGLVTESDLTDQDNRMFEDVWDDLDLHDSYLGLKGKLALAGNTWRARWKYRYFSEISVLHALWIQVKGVLFMKNPQLQ